MKPAERKVCFARAAACPFAWNWQLGDNSVLFGRHPPRFAVAPGVDEEGLGESAFWPAAGSEDTELGVLMELEVGHGEAEVYTRVQA